ncbi:MAG: superoxide dismutase family protein [Pseudonocardiaceae bacterium]|nr:superoxide dismutase family protein [Pseudonocardiaceae bacterium]
MTRTVRFRTPSARIWAALAGGCLVAATAGCSGDSGGAENGGSHDDSGSQQHSHRVSHSGALQPPEAAQGAVTYDPAAAAAGAQLSVSAQESGGATAVELTATGLSPDRGYAVHAHTDPCGATGDAAGPHFQHRVDPAATPQQSSTDPAYANPDNEIWLELRTDPTGAGQASTTVPFVFSERAPASVVLHEEPTTAAAPGEAGSAGGRVACLTVPFE